MLRESNTAGMQQQRAESPPPSQGTDANAKSVPRPHVFAGANFPSTSPNDIIPTYEPEHLRFNAQRHLQLEAPEYVKMLTESTSECGKFSTDLIDFPVPPPPNEDSGLIPPAARAHTAEQPQWVPFNGLAYTAPFRVLSDEGVRAFREIIDDNEKFSTSVPQLVPKCIRGLGYRSDFVRDFNYAPELLSHLSHCAGTHITPHGMGMNVSQINFGEIGAGPVNQWHLDSVPFVMVLLLSDATDMVGGELLVARVGDTDPKQAIEMIRADTIDPALIDSVAYPGPGYAIFMQGSRIAHAVTAVEHAREKRLTCVNSYQSLNPFDTDSTVYKTFSTQDGDAAPYEFARHVAWRVQGQLNYLINKVPNGQRGRADADEILDGALAELQRARGLINNTIEDERPYDVDGAAAAAADAAIARMQKECYKMKTGATEAQPAAATFPTKGGIPSKL